VTGFAGLFEDHLGVDAIVAYVDGELSLTAYQRAAAHLQRCPMCAAEVADQSFARESLRTASAPHMPSSLLANLRSIPVALPMAHSASGVGRDPMTGQAIRVHMARDVTRSRRFRLGASAIVAGIAVGAFVSATPGAAPAPAPTTPPGSVGPGTVEPISLPAEPSAITPNR
jgi:anti-sigma factor RsiW